MTPFFNRVEDKEKRRSLRRNASKPEVLVWSRLRGKQLLGLKFRRQYSVGPYVVAFYCPALKLAVEIDGETHFRDAAVKEDDRRQAFVESFGIRFLRYTNGEVGGNLDGVMESIRLAVEGMAREGHQALDS